MTKRKKEIGKSQRKNAFLTAGAASNAPSAVEKVTYFSPFSFINLGPSCAEGQGQN